MTTVQAFRGSADRSYELHEGETADTVEQGGRPAADRMARRLRGDVAGLVIGLFAMLLLVCLAYPPPG